MYEIPHRQPQTSWRSWGGIQTETDVAEEKARIEKELAKLQCQADFPVKVLPLQAVRTASEVNPGPADAVLLYAAGGPTNILDVLVKTGKPVLIFLRR